MTKLSSRQQREALKTLENMSQLFYAFGWIQGEMGNDDLGYCLIGALNQADGPGEQVAQTTIEREMGGRRIIEWNDAWGRTFGDVEQLMARAKLRVRKGQR